MEISCKYFTRHPGEVIEEKATLNFDLDFWYTVLYIHIQKLRGIGGYRATDY